MHLVSRGRTLSLLGRVKVVGILNLTPDSFYDGGLLNDADSVVTRARQYLRDGANILELGAESTNQDSNDLSAEHEMARLLPSLLAVRSAFPDAWISVDTYKSSVALAALSSGADMINDVTAGRGDPSMFSVLAESRVPYICMYSKDLSARTTVFREEYDDVTRTIHGFLESRIQEALAVGMLASQIVVDPGLGHFISSKPEYSYTILEQLRSFTDLAPVLVSPSRKSFLAGPQNDPPSKRLHATLEATKIAAKNGASLIRTHDVWETVQVLLDRSS